MAVIHPKYRAAVVQAAPVYLDLAGTVDKTIALIEEAARGGASLVAFPEAWIPGYPFWAWMGAPAWGLQFFQRYHDNSLEVGSPEWIRICDAARDNDIYVVLGYSERAGGSLYLGQAHFTPDGEATGIRRKLKPTHVERTIYGEGQGDSILVRPSPIGRIGALCCWEHLQPLTRYAMYSLGEQVHIASWPSFSLYKKVAYALSAELNLAASQMYAAEGQCFVLAATMVTDQNILDLLVDSDERAGYLELGGGASMIFGPDGSRLSDGLPEHQEGIIYADIDLGMITLAKAAADPVGHYSRPDVTRLLLNRQPAPVTEALTPLFKDADAPNGHVADTAPALSAELQ